MASPSSSPRASSPRPIVPGISITPSSPVGSGSGESSATLSAPASTPSTPGLGFSPVLQEWLGRLELNDAEPEGYNIPVSSAESPSPGAPSAGPGDHGISPSASIPTDSLVANWSIPTPPATTTTPPIYLLLSKRHFAPSPSSPGSTTSTSTLAMVPLPNDEGTPVCYATTLAGALQGLDVAQMCAEGGLMGDGVETVFQAAEDEEDEVCGLRGVWVRTYWIVEVQGMGVGA